MVILCDTCSILMLLRIAPDMFIDPRYACKTIRDIHDEVVQTTKFKTKYPWAASYRSKLKTLVLTEAQKKTESGYFVAVKTLNDWPAKNERTQRPFDLSYRDMKVISHSLTFCYAIATGDRNLVDFIKQEFADECLEPVASLDVINMWLKSGVIVWDSEKLAILDQWLLLGERPQPEKAKQLFERLIRYKYPGP